MEVLIRQRDARKQLASIDRSINAAVVTIGSDPDQDIRLGGASVRGSHAQLRLGTSGVEIVCTRGASVSVNNETVNRCVLNPGDNVNLAENKITVVETPAGFDLAFDLTPVAMEIASVAGAYKTNLSQTKLGLRKLSWTLAITALLVTMLIPLGHRFLTNTDNSLASSLPLSDSAWSSGPLHEAHSALESNCKACHQKLFQKVTNSACDQCHSSTIDHIVAVEQNQHLGLEINGRCASCHKEHNEPNSTLVDSSNSVCTACHADIDLIASNRLDTSPLGRVSEFSLENHPAFTAVILNRPEDSPIDSKQPWQTVRVALPSDKENSQLKFNHEVHMNAGKVLDSNSQTLSCGNCHALNVDGEHFDSLTYESNCANSGCHELALDVRNRLPHGYPDIVVSAVEGYYLRKFGNDGFTEDARSSTQTEKRRRFGGGEKEECTDSPYECALQLADDKIIEQFSVKGCITCHIIDETTADSSADRFKVGVVKLTEDYHPGAKFDHESHEILIEPGEKNNIQGNDACLYCHNVSISSSSNDILVPELETCTVCHADQQVGGTVELGCTQCHAYHPQRRSIIDGLSLNK